MDKELKQVYNEFLYFKSAAISLEYKNDTATLITLDRAIIKSIREENWKAWYIIVKWKAIRNDNE